MDEAPPAEDFRLTGSNRTVDMAEAAGQAGLFEAPAPQSTDETVGATDEEVAEVGASFDAAEAASVDDGFQITHVFDPPAKAEIVRMDSKVRVAVNGSGWLTPDEAKARIAQWRENAVKQGDSLANSEKVVLSLFDRTGAWSEPWAEAGYQVWRFDIQNDPEMGDVNNFSVEFFSDWFGNFDGMDVYAVLAACPCTDFASSGARHFAAKDADGRTRSSVELVKQTLATIEYFKPQVWAIENPVGRIEKLGGLPPWRLSFQPNHFGDPYTKRTLLWGRFNADLPIAPVEPTEGSKMWSQYGGASQETKNARSITPEGFAYAFFAANNAVDHPLMAVANKYDRLDRGAIKAALDAGITPNGIDSLVEDHYYQELDDEAANKALRDAAAGAGEAKTPEASSRPEVTESVAPESAPVGQMNDVDNPLRFASGMSRANDFVPALEGGANVGIEINELSDASVPRLAKALAQSDGHLFVDSGAFSLFRANLRAKELGQTGLEGFEEGGRGLDFDAIIDRYLQLDQAIADADRDFRDDDGSTNNRAFYVMPDIVGNQAASIKLAEKYADEIAMFNGKAIVPIQKGELSPYAAFERVADIVGTSNFIVGVPSNEKAFSLDDLRELIEADKNSRIMSIHFLGAASEKTLGPKLEVLRATKFDGEVSADANLLRSKMYGSTSRADALRKLLQDFNGDIGLDALTVTMDVKVEETGQTAKLELNAGRAMRELDARTAAAKALLECLQ